MTPAPTTRSRFGTAGSDSAPVEVTMRFSSTVTPGKRCRVRAGGDDDRLGLDLAGRTVLGGDATLPGPAIAPVPRNESILFFLKRYATPEVLASTTESLWVIIAGRSSFGVPTLMPKAGKSWPAFSNSSEVWRSAFDGMQPTLRQVPPKVASFSMTATLRPSSAARMAQT